LTSRNFSTARRRVTHANEGAIVFKLAGPEERFLDLKFRPDNKSLVAASVGNIYFIDKTTDSAGLKYFTAGGWHPERTVEKQPTTSIAFIRNDVFIGCQSGKLLRIKGYHMVEAIDAHDQMIGVVTTRKNDSGIISGSIGGKIIVWNSEMVKEYTIDLKDFSKELGIINSKVRAVSESYDGSRIVIGTRSSHLLEYDTKAKKLTSLNCGHFNNELWGLSIVPKSTEIVTCGQDFMVARWDLNTRKLVKKKKIPYLARVCDISPNGEILAVGCMNGKVKIMNISDLKERADDISDRQKDVTCLKFSPDGQFLAVGSKDCNIFIYKVADKFKKCGENRQHRSPIMHMDWSEDSLVLQSNDSTSQLMYYSMKESRHEPNGFQLYRNTNWKTWTCIVGWPVLGIWPAISDGEDVNAVDRSLAQTTLVTADDFGKVKLFKYPSAIEFSSYNSFSGHSNIVADVRFAFNQDFVVSIGAVDRCIFQWKYHRLGADEDKMLDIRGDGEMEKLEVVKGRSATLLMSKAGDTNPFGGGGFQMEDMGGGDQAFGDNRQYITELKAGNLTPEGFKKEARADEPPQGNLYLKYVFGYNGHTKFVADGPRFIDESTIVYSCAALGVVLNIKENYQRFFNLHMDEITTIAVSPDKKWCATGTGPEEGRTTEPEIYVWSTSDPRSTKDTKIIKDYHKKGVRILRFSPQGSSLLTIGNDKPSHLAVYDWANERILCSSKVDKSGVIDADWQNETTFVTVGRKHIKFWMIKLSSVTATNGIWGAENAEPLSAAKFGGPACYVGSEMGNISGWVNCIKKTGVKAHDGAVTVLCFDSERKELVSGGEDGLVKVWKVENGSIGAQTATIDLTKLIEQWPTCPIRSIDTYSKGKLLIGTKNTEVFTYDTVSKELDQVVYGHSEGELWGLASHPTKPLVVTCGGDKTIRMWDVVVGQLTDIVYIEVNARAIDWSSDGLLIVCANTKGEIQLFDAKLDLLTTSQSIFEKAIEWIEDIKFSPSSQMIAFGSHGSKGEIQVMAIIKEAKYKLNPFKVIQVSMGSEIMHLDWSVDDHYLVVNTSNYEIKFVNVANSQTLTRSNEARNVVWSTWTSKYGFPVQGIIQGNDPMEVNTVVRSQNQKLLATGDDFYYVNLFRYPSVAPKSGFKRFIGHSSHITRVKFMLKDNCVVSIGGKDKSIIVWATDFGGDHEAKIDFFKNTGIDLNQ
jgi:WD40 repeat protein